MSDLSTLSMVLDMALSMSSDSSIPSVNCPVSPDMHIVTFDAHTASTLPDLPTDPFPQLTRVSGGLPSLGNLLRSADLLVPGSPQLRSLSNEPGILGLLSAAQNRIMSLTRDRDDLVQRVASSIPSSSPAVTLTSPILPSSVSSLASVSSFKMYTISNPSSPITYWPDVHIHKEIYTLASKGFCPPLSLFTIEALQSLANQATTFMKKMTISDGSTAQIVNPNSFRLESDLSLPLWREAWVNYLLFLREVCDSPMLDRWTLYFQRLFTLPNLERDFSAILVFDIDWWTRFHTRRFNHDEMVFCHRL